jgi:hypothetical protein
VRFIYVSRLLVFCFDVYRHNAGFTLAAQLTPATMSGTVTYPSGTVVAKAQVSAAETSTGAITRGQSNGAGFCVLKQLEFGRGAMQPPPRQGQ